MISRINRLAMLSLGATVFLCALSLILRIRLSESPSLRSQNSLVEAVLTNVISDYLPSNTVDDDTLARILAIQDSLKCFTEGTWHSESELNQKSYRFARLNRSTVSRYLLSPSCSSSRSIANSAAELCTLLSARSVLLVGPETTFYLHSLWLNALEELENRPYRCLGLEFCSFHHICQYQSDRSGAFTTDNGRFQRPPNHQDLISSGTSLLRYVLSTSLHTSNNPNDAAYMRPVVDPATGVRVRNNYWKAHAKKADVIILNRGPLPAPAWSYVAGDLAGNWSFVDQLYLNKSTIYLDENKSFANRIINAALHVTLVSFLPSTIHALSALQEDPVLRRKILIWHGSWYLQPLCTVKHRLFKYNQFLEDLSYPLSPHASFVTDPWSLYYDAQGGMYLFVVVMYSNFVTSLHAKSSYERHPTLFWNRIFPSGDSSPSPCGSSYSVWQQGRSIA